VSALQKDFNNVGKNGPSEGGNCREPVPLWEEGGRKGGGANKRRSPEKRKAGEVALGQTGEGKKAQNSNIT